MFFRNFFFGREATGRGTKRNRNKNQDRKTRRTAFQTSLRKELRLEPLEPRQLLAINITYGVGNLAFADDANFADNLTVDYNLGTDTYTVTTVAGNTFTDGTGGSVPSLVLGGGNTTATFLGTDVASLQVDSVGGADDAIRAAGIAATAGGDGGVGRQL